MQSIIFNLNNFESSSSLSFLNTIVIRSIDLWMIAHYFHLSENENPPPDDFCLEQRF